MWMFFYAVKLTRSRTIETTFSRCQRMFTPVRSRFDPVRYRSTNAVLLAQECAVGAWKPLLKLAIADNTYISAAASRPQISFGESAEPAWSASTDETSAMRC